MSSEQKPLRLGEILLENGMITDDQLELALADQKKNGGLLGEILVGWGYTTEEAIVQALVKQFGFPVIKPAEYDPNEDVVKLIEKEDAVKGSFVGLDKFDSVLTVAMSNPLDQQVISALESGTGLKVRIFISTYSEIMRGIEKHYNIRKPGST